MAWLLALAFVFRSLILPGLTPVIDHDAPFGLSIAFCHSLTGLHEDGADFHAPHSHPGADPSGHDHGKKTFSDHCSVSFVGGLFLHHVPAHPDRLLQPPEIRYQTDYHSPTHPASFYPPRQSRAPPLSQPA